MRAKLAAVLVVGGLLMAGCGGSTSESSDDSGSSSVAHGSQSQSQTAQSSASTPAPGGNEDQPGREVQQLPSQAPAWTDQDRSYLSQLDDKGIDTKPVGDQLIAAGSTVCQDNGKNPTIDAVAGQLVAQQRTKLNAEDAAKAIAGAAKQAYC